MTNLPSFSEIRNQFENYLLKSILVETLGFPLLQEMIFYHFGWQEPKRKTGKRLRPMLTLLSAELQTEDISIAYPAAAAIEILHNFTLVHDDIEDNSDTRHGQQTLWKKYGVAQAINTGDYMSSLALAMISHSGSNRPELMMSTFLESSSEVTKGQHEDIKFEKLKTISEQEYLRMIGRKTASLFSASMKLGAISAGADEQIIDKLGEIGHQFGIAYQIYDDYLGIWGDPSKTGKPAGNDLIEHKKSYPILLGMQLDSSFGEIISSDKQFTPAEITKSIRLLESLGMKGRIADEVNKRLAVGKTELDTLKETSGLDTTRLIDYLYSLFNLVKSFD